MDFSTILDNAASLWSDLGEVIGNIFGAVEPGG